MMRTFIAVEVTNESLLEEIKKIQTCFRIKTKPVELHNLHFTLMFLGEVSESDVEKVKHSLESIEFPPFEVKFQGIGVFPKPKFPRVIWIGVEQNSGEKMIQLAKKVEGVLRPLGFKSDKPFKPHLTIFRIKNKVDITEQISSFNSSFGTQYVTELKLKKSDLTQHGPIYTDILAVKAK